MADYQKDTGADLAENLHKRIRDVERLAARLRHQTFPPGPWIQPTLLNSWVNAGAPYANIAYRKYGGLGLEFKGHITGGASGSVAFTVDTAHLPSHDVTFLTDVVSGGVPVVGRIEIDSSTGDVTITYPV